MNGRADAMAASGARPSDTAPKPVPLVVVTGLSGAGLSTAIKALEDIGYQSVDNLPIPLLSALVELADAIQRPSAAVLDCRNAAFSPHVLLDTLHRIGAGTDRDVRLLFLEADDETLQRRFTETRRRHPLAVDRTVGDGIRRERELLAPLREAASTVIDSTALALPDFRRMVQAQFPIDAPAGPTISIVSFSFRHGLPREADLVFDVRFLANPHWDPLLRPKTGRDEAVGAHIVADPAFAVFWTRLTALLEPLLHGYGREGKSYLTIAVGCTGGRHRSVYVAERLTAWLRDTGVDAILTHRDIDRSGGRQV